MKRSVVHMFFVIMLFTALAASSTMAQKTLKIGDAAPEIKAAKWFKGAPVTSFEKGKIYVVEFWATWCGPCKASIPHITKLAHKYKGEIIFIGMDASEKAAPLKENIKLVDKFMLGMGEQMDYNVALDTEDKYMEKKWLSAAAQLSIPVAFIVDKNAKIAWIGHPMYMEEILDQIYEGKYDGKSYAEKFGAEQAKNAGITTARAKLAEVGKALTEAKKNKDDVKVIAECEALLVKYPELQKVVDESYMPALLRVDPDKLYSIAKKAKETNSAERLQSVILFTSHKGLDKKFYDFSIEYLVPKIEKEKNDKNNLNPLCWLEKNYELAGNMGKAIETTNRILNIARQDEEAYKIILQAYEKKLAELKSGKL